MRELVIIGGGPAGTAAALAARARGWDVVLVESHSRPQKSHALTALAHELCLRPLVGAPASRRGDGFLSAVRRAGEIAASIEDHRNRRLDGTGVARVFGTGELSGAEGEVIVRSGHRVETIRARRVIVATGASPSVEGIAGAELASEARSLMDGAEPPASAVLIGGGREGVALAGLLACAGTQVTLLESGLSLLPDADIDVSAASRRLLERAGVRIHIGARALALTAKGSGIGVTDAQGATHDGSLVILATSRQASTPVAGGEWLFHAGAASGAPSTWEMAARDGAAVVAAASGRPAPVPRDVVPCLVAGLGGAAWVGRREADVRAGHVSVVGRAQLHGRGPVPPGFVKVVADRGSGRLLGVHVAGSLGREAIAVAAALMEAGAGRAELASMAFAPGSPAAALAEAADVAAPA